MHASLIVTAAALFGCLMPAIAPAQAGPGSEDLRTEIRRIVREEVRAALREVHGGAATPAPMGTPGAPMRPMAGASPHIAAPVFTPPAVSSPAMRPPIDRKRAEKARVVEKLDGEMGQMNELIEQIEKEVAKTQAQVQTYVVEKSKGPAGGNAQRARATKIVERAAPKRAKGHEEEDEDDEDEEREGKGPAHQGPSKVESRKPGGQAKSEGGEVFQFEFRPDGDHKVVLRTPQGSQAGQPANTQGCSCGCPCCGGEAKATPTPKAIMSTPKATMNKTPHLFFLGEPATGNAAKREIKVRAKANRGEEEEDEEDEEEEHREVRRVVPPAKAKSAPAKPPVQPPVILRRLVI